MYDLIGDIHGYATELKSLLYKMGYREVNGVWQHPERTAFFLGDFIDKGPEQVEVVQIAKAMVESGSARAVMGNHEFNAVLWASEDPLNPGQFLRSHTQKNLDQHQEFLEQVGEDSKLHSEFIDWFKSLPIYWETGDFRVVHACWHPQNLKVISEHTDSENCLLEASWRESSEKGTPLFEALETVLKGLEIKLPDGLKFLDKYGHPRSNIRAKWWLSGSHNTVDDIALAPLSVTQQLPKKSIDDNALPGYDRMKPVFVGHYWLTGTPAPMSKHVACLDFSIAADHDGKLCAYRWDGEGELVENNFCHVSRHRR